MKRIIRTAGLFLLCASLMTPIAEARGRNDNQNKTAPARTHQSLNRPAQSAQQPSATQRPAQTVQRPTQSSQRPGNSGLGPSSNQRPGNQNPGNQRPGNYAPGNQGASGPIGSNRPNYKPTPPPPPPGGQHRPGMAPPVPWGRPTPPPSWRPPIGWRPFRSVLGISFGTSIGLTVNALINSGYTVSHYSNNLVYVSNVPMLNMIWPNAILHYNVAGGLCGSQFIFTSGFYDMTRYNSVYASLINTYGAPYSIQNTASGIEANWWGTGNQFITLSFAPQYTASGSVAYYTTLSFGN